VFVSVRMSTTHGAYETDEVRVNSLGSLIATIVHYDINIVQLYVMSYVGYVRSNTCENIACEQ
jgi:hypothetical protein